MVFEEKGALVNYMIYSDARDTIEKRLQIKANLGTEFNKIIAVYNSETKSRINHSMLSNYAYKVLIQKLEGYPEDKALEVLKKEFKPTEETGTQSRLFWRSCY